MKISLEVPDHKAAFILQLLAEFPYVRASPAKPRKAKTPNGLDPNAMDATDWLLSTEANRRALDESIAQLRNGQAQARELIEP